MGKNLKKKIRKISNTNARSTPTTTVEKKVGAINLLFNYPLEKMLRAIFLFTC